MQSESSQEIYFLFIYPSSEIFSQIQVSTKSFLIFITSEAPKVFSSKRSCMGGGCTDGFKDVKGSVDSLRRDVVVTGIT